MYEACAGGPGVAQSPVFDDTAISTYYDEANPQNSVEVAGAGVKATVTAENADGSLTVHVEYPLP